MRKFGLLVSARYLELFGDVLSQHREQALAQGVEIELIVMPMQQSNEVPFRSFQTENILSASQLARVHAAYISEDVQFNWKTMRCFFGAIEAAPSIQWVQISWIGIDFPICDGMKRNSLIHITNASGTNAAAVATSTVAAILALNRGLHHWVIAKSRREWMNRDLIAPRYDISGKVVLIYGFGAIGQEIGRMCKGIGMQVQAVRRRPDTADRVTSDAILAASELESAVAQADVVVISSPLNEETRNKFDRRMLERMKPSAVFVNVGRGAVADENALAELLRDRRIAGAYLDVFEPEPLREESLLWDLPNVIISPHDAATCADNASRVQSIFLNNLDLFVQGKPLTNTVRPALTGKL